MKNKKAFFIGIELIIYGVLAIIILGLLIWGGYVYSDVLVALIDFIKEWWWAIALSITGLIFHRQLMAILNAILSKFGIKV